MLDYVMKENEKKTEIEQNKTSDFQSIDRIRLVDITSSN
jgi:hypothetical protein